MLTAVIGDVHGCFNELVELVNRLKTRRVDRIIMLGDLTDKGPMPAECVAYVRRCGFEAVASNHEERHVRWWRREKERRETGKPNMMKPWHDDRDRITNELFTENDINWMASLPPWLEIVPGWFAVHGGFQPNIPIAKQDPTKVLRLRYIDKDGDHVAINYEATKGPKQPEGTTHWTEKWAGPESVVYGHEAFSLSVPKMTRRWENRAAVDTWGIDTGCVHGGHLTALVFEPDRSPEVVRVKAKECYYDPPFPIRD